jgi:hypothetical protein
MNVFAQTFPWLLASLLIFSSCTAVPGDHTGPTIRDVSTSGNVIVISDCPSTSATITANVTDESTITSVQLWYRVESDKKYISRKMEKQSDKYTATLEGTDLQSHGYGVIEFYIRAEDEAGNTSKSPVNSSLQFLPCVNN